MEGTSVIEPRTEVGEIITALREVVCNTYGLMSLTHLCHWNVEGPQFFALHQAFEDQYNELFTAVDEIAERIRALGGYAPGGIVRFAQESEMPKINEDASAAEMVKALIEANHVTSTDCAKARDMAAECGDKETEDMMIARIQVHEKTNWMLKSYLKQ